MRRASLLSSLILLIGCVGDSAVVSPLPSNDASTQDSSSPPKDGGGGDVSVADAADASAVLCGFAGEGCCVKPLAPCNDGMICSTSSKTCVASDAWAVGHFMPQAFVQKMVTAHWDGSAWALGEAMDPQPNVANFYPLDIFQEGSAVRFIANGNNNAGGKMFAWNSVMWVETKANTAYSAPLTNVNGMLPVLGAVSSIGGEFWLAGNATVYRCAQNASNCAKADMGVAASWAQGAFGGVDTTDFWFTDTLNLLHFDGKTWTKNNSVVPSDLFGMGWVSPKDIWIGRTKMRHWDGATWSPAQLIEGAPVPGAIYSISGGVTDDVWAVGNNNNAVSFAAHWNGTDWKYSKVPQGATGIVKVWAPGRSEAFMVGDKSGLFRWDGTAWSAMPTPTASKTVPANTVITWDAIHGSARPRR